jgi:TonB-linked SusC/RagA family outer membrane protein
MRKTIKTCCALVIASLSCMQGAQAQQKVDSVVNVSNEAAVNVAFGKVAKQDLLGGVSTINVTELLKKSYSSYSLDNLSSLVSGFTGGGNIWGQGALLLIDGVPRDAGDVRLTEVETITVLKGASAVALYGGSAAKGVILLTTKRGGIKPLTIDVRANTGVYVPKSYPKYLNAGDYKALYNEALQNDRITTGGYSQGEIDSTRAGIYGYKYPDIDFFGSEYLKKSYRRSDLTTEISGGNAQARYYTNVGLWQNNNFLKYGQHSKDNTFGFNVRGNVDMNLNSWLSAFTDVGIISNNSYLARGDFWGATANMTSNFNRFSPLLPISLLDPNNANINTLAANALNKYDGQIFGGQSTTTTNVIADMLAPGYSKRRDRTFLFNLGTKADLASILKGLSFNTAFSMDYRSFYTENYQMRNYAVFAPTWSVVNGKDVITNLTKINNDESSTSETIGNTLYIQTNAFKSHFDYKRTFGSDHNLSAKLLGWWFLIRTSSDANTDGGSDYHPIRNTNLGFQANYNFRNKYYFDFTSAYIHSAKLPPGNRNALSPTFTAGWRISEEKFLKDAVSFLDDLKISASYASINQDLDVTGFKNNNVPTDYYLYSGYYGNGGNAFGWRDGAISVNGTVSVASNNFDLDYIKRQEYRASLYASLFKNLLDVDVNYFVQDTKGLLARGTSIYPSWFTGNGNFLPWINYNNDRRSGLDFAVNVNKNLGKVSFSAGVTGMFFSSKATQRDELFLDAYQNRAGRALDASFGYISEGFFQSQAEIDDYLKKVQPTIGNITDLRPGDIKYSDVNNDGIIDTKDQVALGRNGAGASPFTYGVNLTVKWKNFTLFALGNGQHGAIGYKNSSYYWNRGTSKFSEVVWDRWTEATKNTATYPRLTSTPGNNNYQQSSFWVFKNNRFNLNRVQLTYDFTGQKFLQNSIVHGLSVYAQGDNLLVVSKERKHMETNVGQAPQFRFYNLGVRASF